MPYVHEVMRHAVQYGPNGQAYEDLAMHPMTKQWGHQYYFFDSATEAQAFIDANPNKQYSYSFRQWGEPHLSRSIIDDRRKGKRT